MTSRLSSAMRLAAPSAAVLLLAACAHSRPPAPRATVAIEPQPQWEMTIAPEDRPRLEQLDARFAATRAGLPRRARAAAVLEGPLLAADGALDQPQPPPGPYRCRRLRLGGTRGLVAGTPGFCAVTSDPEGIGFAVQTGSERPQGWLLPMNGTRQVFLGATGAGKAPAPAYGTDAASGLVGVLERIGPFRWRLLVSRPAGIDVYELIPVPPKMKGDPGAVQAPE